jgi:hypothetical protein
MSVHLLLLGILGAISGVLALVANQKIEPFYSLLIRVIPAFRFNFVPRIKILHSAKVAINDANEIRIRDGFREELQIIHGILCDEFDFDQQYYPVKLRFMHNSFEMSYADNRTQSRRDTSREDLISLIDEEVSDKIGKVAATMGVIAIISFAILIILSVL